jgi:hypothetical protein
MDEVTTKAKVMLVNEEIVREMLFTLTRNEGDMVTISCMDFVVTLDGESLRKVLSNV